MFTLVSQGSGDCSPCAAGYYCDTIAGSLSAPSGAVCPAGYACSPGTAARTQFPCALGGYCPAGATNANATRCVNAAVRAAAWVSVPSRFDDGSTVLVGRDAAGAGLVAFAAEFPPTVGAATTVCNGAAPAVAAAAATAVSLASGDVNSDGLDDVVAVLANGTVVVIDGVSLSLGAELLTTVPSGSLESGAHTVVVLDANGDGLLDVLIGGTPSASSLLLSSASGTLAPDAATSAALASVGTILAATTADVDSNGAVDVFVATSTGCYVLTSTRLTGLPAGPLFTASADSCSGLVFTDPRIAAGDLDSDGDVDVLVCGTGGSPAGRVLLNNGLGQWTPGALGLTLQACGGVGVGDVNADGHLDVFVSSEDGSSPSQLFVNRGAAGGSGGVIFLPAVSLGPGVASPSPVLLDVTGDGVDDIPSLGYVGAAPTGGLLYIAVRVLGRGGGRSEAGVSACLRWSLAGVPAVSCRVVGGGTGSGSHGLYEVLLSVPAAAQLQSLAVRHASGRLHSVALSPSSFEPSVLTVADWPEIVSVALAPSRGVVTAGGSLFVTLTAAWNESSLVPLWQDCCFVNGVNVSSTFVSHGNGSYGLTYTVRPGDADVFSGPPAILATLRDPAYGQTAPASMNAAVRSAAFASAYAGLTIDTHAPEVVVTSGPVNGSTRSLVTETIAVCCGCASPEGLGCTVSYRLGGTLSTPVNPEYRNASSVNATHAQLSLSLAHGDAPTLWLLATDAAGHVSAPLVLSWTVDAELPVTLWPADADAANLSANASPEFVFSCSRAGCRFLYSLNGAPYSVVGQRASGTPPATATCVMRAGDVFGVRVVSLWLNFR